MRMRTRMRGIKPNLRVPRGYQKVVASIPQYVKDQGAAAVGNYLASKNINPAVVGLATGAANFAAGAAGTAIASALKKRVSVRGTVQYGQGMSRSRTYFGRVPKLKLVGTPNKNFLIERVNGSGLMTTSTYGTQVVTSIKAHFDSTQLSSIANTSNSVADANFDQWKCEPISCEYTLMLQNQEIGNCTAVIYECVARKDVDDGPITCWTNGAYDIATSWTEADYGGTPYKIPKFNQNWRVFKETRVDLMPGKTHEHRGRIGGYRPRNQSTLSTTYLKGISTFVFVVLLGTPVWDGSNVSTSTPTVIYTMSTCYTAKISTNLSPVYGETNPTFASITAANIKTREMDGDLKTGDQTGTSS